MSDKIFTSTLGLSSPWVTSGSKSPSLFSYLHSLIFFATPAITCFFFPVVKIDSLNMLLTYLKIPYLLLILVDIYVSLFNYSKTNKRCARFSERYFKDDLHLETVFKPVGAKSVQVYLIKYVSLYVVMMFSIGVTFFNLCRINTLLVVVMALRHFLAFPIVLQWSVCMYHVERYLSKAKVLFKTKLWAENVPAAECDLPTPGNTVETKRINMDVFDDVIGVYRSIADKHAAVNDYYGAQMCLDISAHIYAAIIITYHMWFSRISGNMYSPLVLLYSVSYCLGNVLIRSWICETVTNKVSVSAFFFKLLIINIVKLNYTGNILLEFSVNHYKLSLNYPPFFKTPNLWVIFIV